MRFLCGPAGQFKDVDIGSIRQLHWIGFPILENIQMGLAYCRGVTPP